MKKHVSAMIVGLALGAHPVLANHNHQNNMRIIQLAQVLAQQAGALSQQANAMLGNGWGVTWQDRKAAQEIAQFAAVTAALARSAQGCDHDGPGGGWNNGPGNGWNNGPGNGWNNGPGHGPGNGWNNGAGNGWNNGGGHGPGNGWNNGGGHGPGNGWNNGGGHGPGNGWNNGPGAPVPGWPGQQHGGNWNPNQPGGNWNPGQPGGGWPGHGGHDDDQIGQELEALFRESWRQANDVERFIYSAPRLRQLSGTWNGYVCSTMRQLRAALNCGPRGARENLRAGLFDLIFGR